MIFTKMQLNGNDFVYINGFKNKIDTPYNFSQKICNRKFGVGADGLVIVKPSVKADCKMEIYNADGSKAKICGNALLLLGKYLYEAEETPLDIKKLEKVKVEIEENIKENNLDVNYNEVEFVTVNMGKPIFNPISNLAKDVYSIALSNVEYNIEYLKIENLHGVIVVDNLEDVDVEAVVEKIKKLVDVKNELNLEFIEVINEKEVKMRVFERGVGETLSCGSGACAAIAIAVKNGFCTNKSEVKVVTNGGEHIVKFLPNKEITIKGLPKIVFSGCVRI